MYSCVPSGVSRNLSFGIFHSAPIWSYLFKPIIIWDFFLCFPGLIVLFMDSDVFFCFSSVLLFHFLFVPSPCLYNVDTSEFCELGQVIWTPRPSAFSSVRKTPSPQDELRWSNGECFGLWPACCSRSRVVACPATDTLLKHMLSFLPTPPGLHFLRLWLFPSLTLQEGLSSHSHQNIQGVSRNQNSSWS